MNPNTQSSTDDTNNGEFPKGKESYCPRCYFDDEKVILREDCPHNQPPTEAIASAEVPLLADELQAILDDMNAYVDWAENGEEETLGKLLDFITTRDAHIKAEYHLELVRVIDEESTDMEIHYDMRGMETTKNVVEGLQLVKSLSETISKK